jgi:hypothetical protein
LGFTDCLDSLKKKKKKEEEKKRKKKRNEEEKKKKDKEEEEEEKEKKKSLGLPEINPRSLGRAACNPINIRTTMYRSTKECTSSVS